MSKNTVDTTITGATRLGTSYYGNPYFMLHTADGNYRTSIDSSISYSIGNHTMSTKRETRVRLQLTKAGRVFGITEL